MHVRLFDIGKGLISIQAEVEISRYNLKHLFSTRNAVIYEIEIILKKHKIEYRIWNGRIRKYINTIF